MPTPRHQAFRRLTLVLLLLAALLATARAEETAPPKTDPAYNPELFTEEQWLNWKAHWEMWDVSDTDTVVTETEKLFRKHPTHPATAVLQAQVLFSTGQETRARQALWQWWEAWEKLHGEPPPVSFDPKREFLLGPISREFAVAVIRGVAAEEAAFMLTMATEDHPEEQQRIRKSMFQFPLVLTGRAIPRTEPPGDRKLFTDVQWFEWLIHWKFREHPEKPGLTEKTEALFQKYPDNASLALLLALHHRELGNPDRSRQALWRWWDAYEKRKGHPPVIRASWSHRTHPPSEVTREFFQNLRVPEWTAALMLVQACEDFPEERTRLRTAMAAQDNEHVGGMHGPTRSTYIEWLNQESFQRFTFGDSGKEDPVLWVLLLGTISACGCPDYDAPDDIAWKEKIARQLMREGKLSALLVAPLNRPTFTEIFRWTMAQDLPENSRSAVSIKSLLRLYVGHTLVSRLLPRHIGGPSFYSLEDHNTKLPPGWNDDDWTLFQRLIHPVSRWHFEPWEPEFYSTNHNSSLPYLDYQLAYGLRVHKADFEGMLQTYRDDENEFLPQSYPFATTIAHSIIQARRLNREVRWDNLADMLLRHYKSVLRENEFTLEEPGNPFLGLNRPQEHGPANLVRNQRFEPREYFREYVFRALPPEARFPVWWHLHRKGEPLLADLDGLWILKEFGTDEPFRLPKNSDNLPDTVLALAGSLPPDFPREAEPWLPLLILNANSSSFQDIPFLTRDTCRRLLEREAALPDARCARAWLQAWTLMEYGRFELITGDQEADQAPYWGTTKPFGWHLDPAWPAPRIKLPPKVASLLPLFSESSIPPEVSLTFLLRNFKTSADCLPDPAVGEVFINLSQSLTPAAEKALTDENWYEEGLYPYALPLPPRDEEGRRLSQAIHKRWEFRRKAELQKHP